jgi:hypothetical protein
MIEKIGSKINSYSARTVDHGFSKSERRHEFLKGRHTHALLFSIIDQSRARTKSRARATIEADRRETVRMTRHL